MGVKVLVPHLMGLMGNGAEVRLLFDESKVLPFNRFREFHAPRVLTSFPTRATVNFSKVAARAVKLIEEKNVSQEVVEK